MPDSLIESVVGLPAPVLRPLVARYTGYRIEGQAPRLHRGLPSRHLTVIVSLAAPIHVAALPGGARLEGGRFGALASGLHAAPVTIAMDGEDRGLSLDLTPAGARALLGMPAAALASEVVDLADVLGPDGRVLVERLALAPAWADRFAILDTALARRLRDGPGVPGEVAWAWRRLAESGGLLPVTALAAEVGWSRRHLGERFLVELGLSPKVAGRVIRFGRARRMLGRPRRPALADVAVACGYYDQAHLTRDFKEFAGCSPGVWMEEELPQAPRYVPKDQ